MFIEREMSRDQMAAIIWTGVTSRSEEREFLFSKEKCIFAHFDFFRWRGNTLLNFISKKKFPYPNLKLNLKSCCGGCCGGYLLATTSREVWARNYPIASLRCVFSSSLPSVAILVRKISDKCRNRFYARLEKCHRFLIQPKIKRTIPSLSITGIIFNDLSFLGA